MAKTSGKLFLPSHDITARVRDRLHEGIQPMAMPKVWVKLHGILQKHRREERIKEGFKMLGRPIVVDELSLIRLGPVRMKLACKAPEKLNVRSMRATRLRWRLSVRTSVGAGVVPAMVGRGLLMRPTLPHRPRQTGRAPRTPNAGKGKVADTEGSKKATGPSRQGAGQDVVTGGQDDKQDDSMQDTSIDTETWDKLGAMEGRVMVMTTQDTVVSMPNLARDLAGSFNQYGSNLPLQAPVSGPTHALVSGASVGELPVGGGDLKPLLSGGCEWRRMRRAQCRRSYSSFGQAWLWERGQAAQEDGGQEAGAQELGPGGAKRGGFLAWCAGDGAGSRGHGCQGQEVQGHAGGDEGTRCKGEGQAGRSFFPGEREAVCG